MNFVNTSALELFDQLPNSGYVRLPVVMGLFGISASTVWRWSRIGRLAPPTKISGVTLWQVADVRETLATLKGKRISSTRQEASAAESSE